LWADGEQGILSECDEKAGRGSEVKKALFVEGKKWLCHHDNALEHSSLLICDFLTTHEMTLVPQPLYLPHVLAPADFFLFTKL
jgi:hypothetical protein